MARRPAENLKYDESINDLEDEIYGTVLTLRLNEFNESILQRDRRLWKK